MKNIHFILFILILFFIYFVGRVFLDFSTNFISVGLVAIILLFSLFLAFLKDPKIGIFFLVFSLPFERIPSVEIGGYTVKINQIIVLILMLAFIGHLVFKKDFKLVKNRLLPFLLLFLAAVVLSFLNSFELTRSILVFLLFCFVFVVFFLVPNLVRDKETLKLIIKILAFVTILVCLFGLYQYLGDSFLGLPQTLTGLREAYIKKVLGFTRIQATLLEPLYLANFLIIPMTLLFALFLSGQIKVKWFWVAAFFILVLTVFILTVARSGYLGLAAAFLVVMLFRAKSFLSLKNLLLFVLVVAISGLLALVFLGGARNQFFAHSQAPLAGEGQASVEERGETSKTAFKVFAEHPILGIGLGNFGPDYDNYPSQMPEGGWQTVNNQYLEILAETGILGLATFILFLLVLFMYSWRAFRITKNPYLAAFILGCVAALIGILVQYNFFSTLYIIYIWFLMGLLVAVQNIIFKKEKVLLND